MDYSWDSGLYTSWSNPSTSRTVSQEREDSLDGEGKNIRRSSLENSYLAVSKEKELKILVIP